MSGSPNLMVHGRGEQERDQGVQGVARGRGRPPSFVKERLEANLRGGGGRARKLAVKLDQEAVAVYFGQDTGGGDGEADCVAVGDGLLEAGPVNGVAAVD